MKKIFTLVSLSLLALPALNAQNASVAERISTNDLRGTARFMSMGGAFGALGGDLSVLSQNPGGIGVYRNNDVGLTLGLDFLNSSTPTEKDHNSRFTLNQIGGVFSFKLRNSTIPNINFGFTYQKLASYNRKFQGNAGTLNTSYSNYIAGICNANGYTLGNIETTDKFDPYNPPLGQKSAPWICIMGYDGLLTDAEGNANNPHWVGQYGDGTSAIGRYTAYEKGYADEYNIAFGGNIKNIVFWGMDFGITSLDYRIESTWGERLKDAYVYNPNTNRTGRYDAEWAVYDNYRVFGTGVNFKLGVIVKPIQELRLGFAFHTPTMYNVTEKYQDIRLNVNYPFEVNYLNNNTVWANNGFPVSNTYDFRTPWRVIASAAGVISNFLIVSADYEWTSYNSMKYSQSQAYDPWNNNYWEDSYWGDSYWNAPQTRSGNGGDLYDMTNQTIKTVYSNSSTIRLGAEFRFAKNFSVRAGYCYSYSPVKTVVNLEDLNYMGSAVLEDFTLDNDRYYLTAGLGYKKGGFSFDIAYVYKHTSSEYYPLTPYAMQGLGIGPSEVKFNDSNLAFTLGYKF